LYKVVSPKEFLSNWKVKLTKYFHHLSSEIEDLVEFQPDTKERMDCAQEFARSYYFKAPNVQRHEVQRLMLLVQIYERKLEPATTQLAEKFACFEMQIVPTSDGAWMTTGEPVSRQNLKHSTTVVIPLKKRIKFDSRTLNLVCQMMFSNRPEVRGAAKLDLNAKLELKQMQQVLSNTEDIFAIAVAEARLTAEVLAVLFPRIEQKETVHNV
jgi:hypothetical protein